LIFGLCTVGWYTEKYRRVEGDIDEHIKRMYQQDVKEAHSKTPQITAAIRGQDMNLDGRMDRMVWGGKAKLNDVSKNNNDDNNDGELGGTLAVANEMTTNSATSNNTNNNIDDDVENDKTKRRRKRRKKRKRKVPKDATTSSEKEEAERIENQQKKILVLQSSIAGIAVGAVAVAAVSVFFNGSGGSGRK
jgi:hypothetical protein